jgi:hypothetical protein
MRPFGRALTLLGALAIATPHADAQHLPSGPAVEAALRDSALARQIPGRWIAARPSANGKLTPAERVAMQATLTRIAELWRASLGALPGVEADESQNAEWFGTAGGAHVAGGDVKLLLWPYSIRNGKVTMYDNAARALFWVNQSVCTGEPAGDRAFGFILAPRLTGHFHGFPMLDSTIVITHRTQPPCIPVTRGEFLQAYVTKLAADRARDDSVWNADAAKREKDLADVARTNPVLVASARAEGTRMRQTMDSARTAIQRVFGDALTRMSPAERASPAYLSGGQCGGGETDPSSCFVDASAPGARAVVRENAAFFDTTRPADAQLITLSVAEVINGERSAPYPTSVLEAALGRLDWAALSALVR